MTAMTEFQLDAIYDAAYEHHSGCGAHGAGLRAVAEAAIAADRAQGAEPVVEVVEVNGVKSLTEYLYKLPIGPLYTRPQASAAVPEGFVLVPVEPTDAMHIAGLNACDDTWISDTRHVNAKVYRTMIAAAPTPNQEIT